MTAHDWYREHIGDYVARAMGETDEALFQEHLVMCESCRAAVAALDADLAWLPLGVKPVTPRPGFNRRVVASAVGERKRPRPGWLWPVLAAASIALAVFTWQSQRAERASAVSQLAATRDSLMAALDTLGVLRETNRIAQAKIDMYGGDAGMVILADEKTHRWNVVVHGLPPAPSGAGYTFWFVTGDGMVRGPNVTVTRERPAVFMLDMPPGARLIKGGALTVEPMDGDQGTPRGPELAHIEL